MGCEEIKKIIPQYFKLTASEEEIKVVEEHLCVCHDCRTALGELMDKSAAQAPAQEKPSSETSTQSEPEPLSSDAVQQDSAQEEMEYFPGKDVEELTKEGHLKEELNPVIEKNEETTPESAEETTQEELEPIQEKVEEPAPAEETSQEETENKVEEAAVEPESTPEPQKEESPEPSPEKELEPLAEEKSEFLPEENDKDISRSKIGFIEYISLAIGVCILGFFIYLLIKG